MDVTPEVVNEWIILVAVPAVVGAVKALLAPLVEERPNLALAGRRITPIVVIGLSLVAQKVAMDMGLIQSMSLQSALASMGLREGGPELVRKTVGDIKAGAFASVAVLVTAAALLGLSSCGTSVGLNCPRVELGGTGGWGLGCVVQVEQPTPAPTP